MKIIAQRRVDMILAATADMEQITDIHGQIVVRTGMFRWSDETIRDSREPTPGDLDFSTEEVEVEEEYEEVEVEEEYEEVEEEEVYEEEPPTLKNPSTVFIKCGLCFHEVAASHMSQHMETHVADGVIAR